MEFIDPRLQKYAEQSTSQESDLLKKIMRETHLYVLKPRMLSGHLQGRFLSMISTMIKPTCVLEIGTFTGYATLCLAEGLVKNGKLITIDVNEELEPRVRRYFSESKIEGIEYIIGNALRIIPTLNDRFDLVFIDADKENYGAYFDMVFDKVVQGGYLLVDNVLWSGKVLDAKPDKDTRAIIEFNKKIQHDARVENVLLPVRDGIMLIRKL
jgi:caffeoyl-CoA O-methyltransferase